MSSYNTYPANSAAAVTADVSFSPSRAVYVGGAGDMTVTMADGKTASFVGVVAGSVLPISITKVSSSGLTASDILALT